MLASHPFVLLLSLAQRFWRHVAPFLGDASPPDARLRGPLGVALAELERLEASLQPQVTELRVRLYEVQLSVLAAAEAWAEGLKLLQSAFASLPEASQEPLWEEKVAFMCKGGGKGLAGEMHKLKDFEPSVQAAVWNVLGSMARTTGEQLNGRLKAVDCLSAEPLLKVRYLIGLAQWLYTHDFPLRDAEDQLMAAIDVLMDYEDVPDAADDDDDAMSSAGGSTYGGGSTVGGGTERRASTAGSRAGGSTVGSAVGSSAGSSAGKGGGGGAEASLSVPQYEQLARIYLMKGMMAGTVAARLESVLVALHYLGRIWAVAIATCNAAEAAKPGSDPAAPPPFAMPVEVAEWATWAPSEALLEAMAAIGSDRVLSAAGLPEPQLTVTYLHYAVEQLLASGMSLHALLPLSLLRAISKGVLHSPAAERAAALRTAHTQHQLGLPEAAAATRAAVDTLRPTPEERRKNAILLKQLTHADAAVVAAASGAGAPSAADGASSSAASVPAPSPKVKSCVRPLEAEWVDLAGLLLAEGEWTAAREWLLEAAPLLKAKGERDHESRCQRLLAELCSLHGDEAAALATQTAALGLCSLEILPWADACLALAAYRAPSDEQLAVQTLEAAIALAAQAAAEHPSAAADARIAQAKLQVALGKAYGKLALEGGAGAEEAALALGALDAAAGTCAELGDARGGAAALLARAALLDALPPPASEPSLLLEAKASKLSLLGEVLEAAHAHAERALFVAAPRSMPSSLSLPASRELASVKASLSALSLRHAALQAEVLAANPPAGPVFPLVEGADSNLVSAFVAPPVVVPPPPQMEHEGRALLHASAAIALAGSSGMRARALLASGEALYARAAQLNELARKPGGHLYGGAPALDVWAQPPPPPAPKAEGEGEGEAEAKEGVLAEVMGEEGAEPAEPPPPPPEPGAKDAAAAEAALLEAFELGLAQSDWATAERAAFRLASAKGVVDAEACARWLAAYQACGAHGAWRGQWLGACAPAERFGLLGKLATWLPQRWTHVGALPAMAAASAALEDGASGSAAWKALAVPADPLAALFPRLPASLRVVLLAVDAASGDAYASAVAMQQEAADPTVKGAEPGPPTLLSRVARIAGAGARLHELAEEAAEVRSAQSKAALQASKDAIFAAQPGTAAAMAAEAAAAAATRAVESGAVPESTARVGIVPASQADASEAETKLRALVSALDEALAPLLAPLLPLLGADAEAGGGETLDVVLLADGPLAALPLELLTPLRQPHVAAVSRDLSTALLARRLAATEATPAAAKKASFLAAVDPRDEVLLPPEPRGSRPQSASAPAKGKGKGKGKATAADDAGGSASSTRKLCAGFAADVLEGARVPFGKDWRAGGSLLGTERVPSQPEWQRLLLGCGAFVFEGPGALHESVEPAALAPLALDSCAACLLFDRSGSDAAARRLAKLANAKSASRIALESSHATAALLSLAGVRTVLTNQWAAAAGANHELLLGVLGGLGNGGSVSEALHASARLALVVKPPPEPEEAPAPAPAEEAAEEVAAEGAPAPAPAPPPESAECLWTVLANPIVYGLPSFAATA